MYWPDEAATAQILVDLAEKLTTYGWSVAIVTSQTASDQPLKENRRGVEIYRVRSAWADHSQLSGKIGNYFVFSLGSLGKLLDITRPGDCLVLMTDPPLLALAATIVGRIKGASVIHWLQDIYPEIAAAMKPGNRLLAAALGPLQWARNLVWHFSTACVTLSEDMAGLVRRTGITNAHIAIVPNWAREDAVTPQIANQSALYSAWALENKFVVAYSGNLGRVHVLMPLLEIAQRLNAERDIVFLFIGDGAQRKPLEAEAKRRGLTNMVFKPAQPREKLSESLSLGHIHVVSLRQGFEDFVYPSKFYGVLAAQRPVLFIGSPTSELARTVTTLECGLVFTPDQVNEVAQALLSLKSAPSKLTAMGGNARGFFETYSGLQRASNKWNELLTHYWASSNHASQTIHGRHATII
ncbi:MAG TPA: glycosyltransferase family 4 protein [Opitutaceae bacterium]|nr:glycosyltransferase family 4 protein [Opitutaceae bacterium]